jgi:hypothetical protein
MDIIPRKRPFLKDNMLKVDSLNMLDNVTKAFQNEAISKFDQALSEYIKKSLAEFGVTFSHELEFHNFIKNRLTVIKGRSKNPHLHELYLDYVDETKPGRYLGS